MSFATTRRITLIPRLASSSRISSAFIAWFSSVFFWRISHNIRSLILFDSIKKIAAEGSCVIVGRCADYALSELDCLVKIFIFASKPYRIERVSRDLNIPEAKAKDLIHRTDKQRANYYNFYTNKKWGDSRSYDISLNIEKIGIDGCVDMILKFAGLTE